MRIRASLMMVLVLIASVACGAEKPYWLEPMEKVHAGFKGTPGYVAQFGDSITRFPGSWTPLAKCDPEKYLQGDDGWPKVPKDKRWRDIIKGFQAKGPGEGNEDGWRVWNILGVIDKVLERRKPEVAIIMIGTNDMIPNPSYGKALETIYRKPLETIVKKCLAAKCIPILNTIPPRRDFDWFVIKTNEAVREIAKKHKVPLVDYYAEILKRRPGHTWQRTLISKDGVHPTSIKMDNFSEENLKNAGFALRNWVNFLMFREIYFRILSPPKPAAK